MFPIAKKYFCAKNNEGNMYCKSDTNSVLANIPLISFPLFTMWACFGTADCGWGDTCYLLIVVTLPNPTSLISVSFPLTFPLSKHVPTPGDRLFSRLIFLENLTDIKYICMLPVFEMQWNQRWIKSTNRQRKFFLKPLPCSSLAGLEREIFGGGGGRKKSQTTLDQFMASPPPPPPPPLFSSPH